MKNHRLLPTVIVLTGLLLARMSTSSSAESRVAQEYMKILAEEIEGGLEGRKISDNFRDMRQFTAGLLDASAGDLSFGDKTGNCRLAWVDWLLRHPVEAIAAGEQFTWDLHEAARDRSAGLAMIIAEAGAKLDAGPINPVEPWFSNGHPESGLAAVAVAGIKARLGLERAYEPLTTAEMAELEQHLYEQSTGGIKLGHRFASQDLGRRVCDLLEKIDRAALLETASALASLVDADLIAGFSHLPEQAIPIDIDGVEGDLVAEHTTPIGRILVGGRGDNRYELDKLVDVFAIIDLGGDDTYIEGAAGRERPLMIIIDLAGDDRFKGVKPGIQGASILGASLLWSLAGNDQFSARDVAQGSTLGGVGILVNDGGDNRYLGVRRVQGQAVGGFGLLLDRSGNDTYRAALLGQGVGGPLGFGMLADLAGDDHYYAGGKFPGGYDDTPGFGGWSQGVGVGPRGVANGGIGVLLDGDGDDIYEYDYFSHGGGYWFAAGFARDFAGDDQRLGATREMHDGSERTVRRFVRWGVGFGCHYGLGLVFDDAGNDRYHADFAGLGFAWDIGIAGIIDLSGNDHYEGRGLASTAHIGLAVVLDAGGDDVYQVRSLGHARGDSSYHPSEKAGGNFAFFLDYGGEDQFGPELQNNSESEQGWAGGFFISRPVAPDL